jgi:cytochrome b6-f complex iron-sulfur subunit
VEGRTESIVTIEHTPLPPSAPGHNPSPPQPDWSAALDARRGAPHHPDERTPTNASRRRFLRVGFWGGIGVALVGGVGALASYLYPRNVRGFGGPVPGGTVEDYAPGADPVYVREAQAYLVNLDPADDRLGGSAGGAGLLALWQKCPHLGCAVPWKSDFTWHNDDGGWFRCPCHGSTYTKAGVLVEGPAPRSMTTMRLEVAEDGTITIHTGDRKNGGPDNPERAVRV